MNRQYQQLLRQLTEQPSEEELRIRELEEEVLRLESLAQKILEELPYHQRSVPEGYIYAQAELEFYAVVLAFKRGRALGGTEVSGEEAAVLISGAGVGPEHGIACRIWKTADFSWKPAGSFMYEI